MQIYTEPEVYQLVEELGAWEYTDDGMLCATYEFTDFMEAMAFVVDVAEISEQQKHHPDIDIRYNVVSLATSTHEAEGAITDKDFGLIRLIEELVD